MACISSGTTNVEEVLVFFIGEWVGEPASSRGEAGLSGEVFGTLVSTVGENGGEGALPQEYLDRAPVMEMFLIGDKHSTFSAIA